MMHRLSLGCALICGASLVHAQSVSNALLIAQGNSTYAWMETAIVASAANANHAAVIYQSRQVGGVDGEVRYSFTGTGFATVTAPIAYPEPTNLCSGSGSFRVDPMVAASTTSGDIYLGCLWRSKPTVMRKPYGGAFSDSIVVYPCSMENIAGWDKCFMAMGPKPQGTSEWLYVGAMVASASGPSGLLYGQYSGHSEDTGTPGMTWSSSQPRQMDAHGADPASLTKGVGYFPLVVPSGATKGRVIVAFNDDRHSQWLSTEYDGVRRGDNVLGFWRRSGSR
jgi:hypothetical protein